MKRLAHCAAHWYWTNGVTGGALNQCDGSGGDSRWDTSAPDQAGAYSKGHPVMTLRWESISGFGGGDFTVRWSFL